jgi:hypothetical protein
VDGGDLFPLFVTRVRESKSGDSSRSFFRDDLQTFHDARNYLMLETGIQTLGVLADHYQIQTGIAARHVRQRSHRAQVRVEIKRLTQPDVD